MQDVIRLLPDNVANQIAAGEVVQRPASVVKELLENSIDAGAEKVQLLVKDAGKTLIQVIDDGKGMSVTDARMAFERHSTSKIFDSEDIYKIKTKGFRGEALASIAAVSQVELKTKAKDGDMGTRILVEANEVVSQEPAITAEGSNFSVKNLFYNVPARRKFLKSTHIEFRHIVDEFLRVALTHPEVEFHLSHNDKEVYRFRKGNLVQRIVEVFGNKIKSNLVPVEIDLDWIKIRGYIGKPESAKKTRGEQFFFVNNRFFRSAYFNKAVLDAYDGLLPNGYNPSYFIYFDIDPEKIDVNIHPSKTEVKFENESDLYALIRSTLKQSIGVYNVAPSLDFEQDSNWQGDIMTPALKTTISAPKIKVDPNYNPFETFQNNRPTQRESVEIAEVYNSSIPSENEGSQQEIPSEDNQSLRLPNGLWLCADNNDLLLIHPYRMHQSLLYHRLKQNESENKLSQQLLFPVEFPIDERRKVQLSAVEESLFKLGFELDYSTEFLSISAIPENLVSENMSRLFDALFEELESHADDQFMEYFYQNAAKVNARPKNKWTSASEINALMNQFKEIKLPKYSPMQKLNYKAININDLSKPIL